MAPLFGWKGPTIAAEGVGLPHHETKSLGGVAGPGGPAGWGGTWGRHRRGTDREGEQRTSGLRPQRWPCGTAANSVRENLNMGNTEYKHLLPKSLSGQGKAAIGRQATKRWIDYAAGPQPPWQPPARRCVATRWGWVLPSAKTGP